MPSSSCETQLVEHGTICPEAQQQSSLLNGPVSYFSWNGEVLSRRDMIEIIKITAQNQDVQSIFVFIDVQ